MRRVWTDVYYQLRMAKNVIERAKYTRNRQDNVMFVNSN